MSLLAQVLGLAPRSVLEAIADSMVASAWSIDVCKLCAESFEGSERMGAIVSSLTISLLCNFCDADSVNCLDKLLFELVHLSLNALHILDNLYAFLDIPVLEICIVGGNVFSCDHNRIGGMKFEAFNGIIA